MFAAAQESDTIASLTSRLLIENLLRKVLPSRACVVPYFVYNRGGLRAWLGYAIRVFH